MQIKEASTVQIKVCQNTIDIAAAEEFSVITSSSCQNRLTPYNVRDVPNLPVP